jgi:membrane protein DedA with SNARE-associated domain
MTIDYTGLIRDYGYFAILIGTFLEGETILILGGVAASLGSLELPLVMLAAFTGSSAGDQLYYFIGRWKGRALLDYFPRWKIPAQKVFHHVERHKNLVILSFRFFYGLRNVTPFVLGITRVETPRFVVLNLIGAAIWAVSFSLIGFLVGVAHERFLGKSYRTALLGALVVLFVGVWLFSKWRNSRRPPESFDADNE